MNLYQAAVHPLLRFRRMRLVLLHIYRWRLRGRALRVCRGDALRTRAAWLAIDQSLGLTP